MSHKLLFAREDGAYPFYEYVKAQRGRWTLGLENAAVGLVLKVQEIEKWGPQGRIETRDDVSLYLARFSRHYIAHAPHPNHPQMIFVLTGFRVASLEVGREEAWRLLGKVLRPSSKIGDRAASIEVSPTDE